jgi:hypothetical protein
VVNLFFSQSKQPVIVPNFKGNSVKFLLANSTSPSISTNPSEFRLNARFWKI